MAIIPVGAIHSGSWSKNTAIMTFHKALMGEFIFGYSEELSMEVTRNITPLYQTMSFVLFLSYVFPVCKQRLLTLLVCLQKSQWTFLKICVRLVQSGKKTSVLVQRYWFYIKHHCLYNEAWQNEAEFLSTQLSLVLPSDTQCTHYNNVWKDV